MSFSQEVKREIQKRHQKKIKDFTFHQNTNNINPSLALAFLFIEKGSVNDPNRSYHLEIACDDVDEAEMLVSLMTEQGFKAKTAFRKGKYIVYLKDRENIADFLGFIGAVNAMMEMENSLIIKDMRNSVNRKVNFEAANIERTVGAAVKEIEDIQYIETHGGLKQLPDGLREIALVRIEYPDATLKSLGEIMDPPLGKSGVNHRLRKIRDYAEKLRSGKRGDYYEKM